MKKLIFSLIFAGMVAVPVGAFAQTDDIVQLNNLTITALAPTTYPTLMLITAQAPGVAQTSYQIQVSATTILLTLNRSRASIGDFTVGDKINVYGFLNTDVNNVDALIMRNLSKPANRYYTQMNRLTVQNTPGTIPGTLVAIADPPAGLPFGPIDSKLYTYQINISARTTLLYRDRRYMPIYEIQVGDKINVYGLYNPVTLTFDAVVLRDLSRPGVVIVPPPPPYNGTVPVITSVSGPTNLTVGQTGTWAISAYDPDNNNNNLTYTVSWGDERTRMYGAAESPALQSSMQTGTFTHSYVNSGTYTVTFTVRDQSGLSAISTLTVSVGGPRY